MLKKLMLGFMLIASSSITNAAIITQSETVNRQDTNFSTSLIFDMFNLGAGFELTKIIFSIDGEVFGNASVESLDASSEDVNIRLEVKLTLLDLASNALVISIPLFTQQFSASAFDGSIDFGGTSGATFTNLSASEFKEEIYTDSATLNAFTGPGTISLGFTGIANSSATGPGNLVTQFQTEASGDVEVIYEYRAVDVSEPSMIALFGLGLMAAGGMRRFRK